MAKLRLYYNKAADFYKRISKYLYSILIIIFPLFAIYRSPIPKVGLLEFIFILFVLVTLIFDFKKYRITYSLIPFMTCIIVNALVITAFRYSINLGDDIGSAARLLFIYGLMAAFARDYFDYKIALKTLVYVSLFVSFYGLIQLAFSFKDIYLYNHIPLLPQFSGSAGSTYDDMVIISMKYDKFFRMRSLFREPAHFSVYITVPALLLLFKKERTIYSIILGLFFLGVSALSLSSTGVLVSIVSIVLFIVYLLIDRRLKIWQMVLLGIGIGGAILAFILLGGWDYFIEKTFGRLGPTESILNIFNDSRMTALPLVFEGTMVQAIFGHGLADIGIYTATYVHTAYSFGIFGVICLALTFGLIFDKISKRSLEVMFFIYLFLNIGTENVFGVFATTYIIFLISDTEESVNIFKKIEI